MSSSNLSEFLELEVAALNEENIELKQRLESLQQALDRSESASRAVSSSSSSSSSFTPELSAHAAPIQTLDVIVCASEAPNKQTCSSQPPPVPPHAGPLSLSRSLDLSSVTSTSSHLSKNGPSTAAAAAAAPARAGSAASSNSASLLRPPPMSVLVPVHPSPTPTPASPECSSTVTPQHVPAASQSQLAARVAHTEAQAQTEAVALAHAGVQCSPQHTAEQQQQVEALASRLKELERELDRHARLLVLRDERIGQLEEGCSQLEASHERDLFELKQYKVH